MLHLFYGTKEGESMARPKTENPKVNRSITIDSDLDKEITEMSERTGISRSNLMNMMMRSVVYQEADIVLPLVKAVLDQRKSVKARRKNKASVSC